MNYKILYNIKRLYLNLKKRDCAEESIQLRIPKSLSDTHKTVNDFKIKIHRKEDCIN